MINFEEKELLEFYQGINREVIVMVESENERGASPEESFTGLMTEMLTDAGETANLTICTDIREDKLGRRQHKINAFALSENYETIDLFISIYQETDHIETIHSSDITTNSNLVKKFLINASKGKLNEMEESSPVFDLVRLLHQFHQQIIRANIFIISNCKTNVDPPINEEIRFDQNNHSILINYHLWDLGRFFRLHSSQNKQEPISINFNEDFGGAIPCLAMPVQNEDYQSFLAIMSGNALADIYRVYGARLLEQNVRSFLQFTGKINKGIRQTIKKEPQMFLAFNNGIAATAEDVEIVPLDNGGLGLATVKDFQIVNGGQTTASIFHSHKQDKSDLSDIFVQVKLTVVKRREQFSGIVARIAEYANSQNKVSIADLSSNHPFHIEFEKLSRKIWAPDPANMNHQTRWFYERARGQYKTQLNREGNTKARRKAFEAKNPRKQVLKKEDIAKYHNAWNMEPHVVAKGRQKSYVHFFKDVDKDFKDGVPGRVFFEDIISQTILFKAAEVEYGRGENSIGDFRYLTVPYTLSYLNYHTNQKISLYKIWKNQCVSSELRAILKLLLTQMDHLLAKTSHEHYGGLISEWGKRERCWEIIKEINLSLDFSQIEKDLMTEADYSRYEQKDKEAQEQDIQHLKEIYRANLWQKIGDWGKATSLLSLPQLNVWDDLGRRIKNDKPLESSQVIQGMEILKNAINEAPALFAGTLKE